MNPGLVIWNRHLLPAEQNRQFVDCRLLDEICGKPLLNKLRKLEVLVSEMVSGTDIQPNELVRKISYENKDYKNKRGERICVAARTMQLICLRGFKEMPWNAMRR